MSRLLILGGTGEGNALAHKVAQARPDLEVVSSLAGVTAAVPELPGQVRVGGFGGAQGLARYLTGEGIGALIDATHPFAATITRHAVEACAQAGVPYLRLERPEWRLPPDTDIVFVPDAEEAARLVARTSACAFLTVGRKALDAFAGVRKTKLVVRVLEDGAPHPALANAVYVAGRPPFALEDEIALLREHGVDTLVTKASGGDATRAKLDAAAHEGARIVLIRRPAPPEAERVFSVDDALAWLGRRL